MPILAHLSDKYMIEALQADVRVLPLLDSTDGQNYAQRVALRKDKPTFETWKFAARYSLLELEEYCRSNEAVFEIINETLGSHSKGLESFLDERIPIAAMSRVVKDVLLRLNLHSRTTRCMICERMIDTSSAFNKPVRVCRQCKEKHRKNA
jgi:hypothetical protein